MLINFIRRKIIRDRKLKWDYQYQQGKWEYLNDPLEEQRFQAVLQALQTYGSAKSILEVGCGEGILQSRMQPGSYHHYLGIDLSEVAIQKAARLCNDDTRYSCADMETFTTTTSFDVIVFTESLYYAKKPVQLLQQYAQFLAPGGHIILSVYKTADNESLLRKIETAYPLKEQQLSTNERGAWYCQVYDKKAFEA
jgi:2-polyprenyl-3-methyl-5-hydroxy-6-metoxy-1,4-benzoquinol methylase